MCQPSDEEESLVDISTSDVDWLDPLLKKVVRLVNEVLVHNEQLKSMHGQLEMPDECEFPRPLRGLNAGWKAWVSRGLKRLRGFEDVEFSGNVF